MKRYLKQRTIVLWVSLCLSTGWPLQAQYDFVVDINGTGDFTSLQAAIDASRCFPDQRITLFVKNGEYREKVRIADCNSLLSIVGENRDSTIIWFDDYFDKMQRGRNSTFYTYTFCIEANGIVLENLTIENRAGRVGQAVALHVTGDRCIIRNCRLLGNQDTLYAAGENSHQFFENCYIEGTVDFIFGPSMAFFESCQIHCKSDAYITASNSPQFNSYGFVFHQCRLTADSTVKSVFLGRPWRDHAKTAFIRCQMGAHIHPQGWDNWSSPKREETSYYAEYQNTGPGSDRSKRVAWCHFLTKKEAGRYSAQRVMNGRGKIPFKDGKWK